MRNMSAADSLDLEVTTHQFVPSQKLFGRYVLQRLIGRGKKGDVWEARDERLDMAVAIKILLNYPHQETMHKNISRCMDLTHPNIVRIYDFVHEGPVSAFVMELVQGQALSVLLRSKTPPFYEVTDVQRWAEGLFSALDFAWKHGRLVHGDLRLGNLMVNQNGLLKIAEFGLAPVREGKSVLELEGDMTGLSLPCLSPQMLAGEPPAFQDDLYSAGACFYELLTGKPLFPGGNVIAQIQRKVPPPIAERRVELQVQGQAVPKSWETWIGQCLAKERRERPAAATEILPMLAPATVTKRTGGALLQQVSTSVAGAIREKFDWKHILAHPLTIVSLLVCAAGAVFLFAIYFPNQRKLADREKELVTLRSGDAATDAEAHPAERTQAWKTFVDHYEYDRLEFTDLDLAQIREARDHLSRWQEKEQKRLASENRKKQEDQAKLDDFEVAIRKELKADADTSIDRQARITSWEKVLTSYDPGTQTVSQEYDDLLTEARRAKLGLEAKLKIEQGKIAKLKEEAEAWLVEMRKKFETLTSAGDDASQVPAAKLASLQEFVTNLTAAPNAADPAVAQLRKDSDSQIAHWQELEAQSIPAQPLDLAAIFQNSPYSKLTDMQKKAVLAKAQEKVEVFANEQEKPDGLPGAKTQDAIVAFQKQHLLPVNGQLDAPTLAAIGLENLNAKDLDADAKRLSPTHGSGGGGSSSYHAHSSKPKKQDEDEDKTKFWQWVKKKIQGSDDKKDDGKKKKSNS